MQKIPKRFTPIAFAFFMSLMMGFVMCATIVAVQTGMGAGYGARVMRAYVFAVPMSFVFILLVKPLVMRLMALSVAQPLVASHTQTRYRKIPNRYSPIVFSFYMGALMDLLMCCAIIAMQIGVDGNYAQAVFKAYLVGMPIAFCSVVVVRPAVVWMVARTVSDQ